MNIVIAVLAFLTALLPLANQGIQQYQDYRRHQPVVTAPQVQTGMKPVLPPDPPEAGQPGVVFYNGEWWKNDNGRWLVWRQQPQYLAQGGANVVR